MKTSQQTDRFSIRTTRMLSQDIIQAYEVYRIGAVEEQTRPASLNKFLCAVIREAIQGLTPTLCWGLENENQ